MLFLTMLLTTTESVLASAVISILFVICYTIGSPVSLVVLILAAQLEGKSRPFHLSGSVICKELCNGQFAIV